jgi:Beta-glucosidase-related glycosidases
MTAHVRFPAIDPDIPCFSRFWLGEILRGRLGFDGVVVSDDLTMAGAVALEPRAEDRVARALAAGCDIVLMLNDRAGVVAALDGVRGVAPVPDQRWRRWGSPLGRAAEMADFEDFGAISIAAVAGEIEALEADFAEHGDQA